MRCARGAVSFGNPGLAALAGLCLLLCAEAAAAPPLGAGRALKGLAYEELLHSGQELASVKKWPQAVNVLQAAVRARPKDATALSELSFALLMAKRLDEAQRTAEEAVKFASSGELKATSIFQLGRVAEARNRKPDAMERYLESLKLRQSDETVRRIYTLNEWSEVVPCRSARSMLAICGCLSQLLGGSCVGEDLLAPAVMSLRASWPSERGLPASSLFLAVQAAGSWFLISHLGRLTPAAQHPLVITDMKAEVLELGTRRAYHIEYSLIDEDLRCGTLGGREINGLGRAYNLACKKEDRHALFCVSSEDGQSVVCPVSTLIGCKRSKRAQVVDEFSGLAPGLSAQVREWEARSRKSEKGQLNLSPSGAVTGTALTGDFDAGGCPGAKAVDYRLY